MIKKVFILSLFVGLMFGGVAQAESHELADPGMLPGNPLYFLKAASEGLGIKDHKHEG